MEIQLNDYEDRSFMIFNVSELPNIDFTQVLETSIDTVRISIDKVKTFVKWDSNVIPSSVDSLTTKEGPYTYNEIITILSGPEWTSNEVLDEL
jgi:hypothetical protein